jgi:hypothetical protein
MRRDPEDTSDLLGGETALLDELGIVELLGAPPPCAD